jgi:plastocyanin
MRGLDFIRAAAIVTLVMALAVVSWTSVRPLVVRAEAEHPKIELYDNCDPRDPAWNTVGGCTLDPREGDVTLDEFGRYLMSPLSLSTVGHPSWRFEPTYLRLKPGKELTVENEGGRDHTFTEVVKFGGGRIAGLNIGLTEAPECVLATGATDPTLVHPGGELELAHLSTGLHTFQCCIHPWMRAAVRVSGERK